MSKKSKKLWFLAVTVFVICVSGAFFYLRSVEAPTPMLTVTTAESLSKSIAIEQRFLHEKVVLFEQGQIEDEHTEIRTRKNNGESSIVLVIDGVEETILGYLDTSDSLAGITLNVSVENSDLVVDYEVHTVFGEESGTMQVAFAQPK